jgi:hypothetical protein
MTRSASRASRGVNPARDRCKNASEMFCEEGEQVLRGIFRVVFRGRMGWGRRFAVRRDERMRRLQSTMLAKVKSCGPVFAVRCVPEQVGEENSRELDRRDTGTVQR